MMITLPFISSSNQSYSSGGSRLPFSIPKRLRWGFLDDEKLYQKASFKANLPSTENNGNPPILPLNEYAVLRYSDYLTVDDLGDIYFKTPDFSQFFLQKMGYDDKAQFLYFCIITDHNPEYWPQVYNITEHLAEKLKNGKTIYRDATIVRRDYVWDDKLKTFRVMFDRGFPHSPYKNFIDEYVAAVTQPKRDVCKTYFDKLLRGNWQTFPFFYREQARYRLWWLAHMLHDPKEREIWPEAAEGKDKNSFYWYHTYLISGQPYGSVIMPGYGYDYRGYSDFKEVPLPKKYEKYKNDVEYKSFNEK